MPVQTWRAPLASPAVGGGTPLASSTTLTDISPAPQLIINGGYLYPGQRLCVEGYGVYSSTTAATLLLGVYWGGVVGTVIAATAATAVATTGASFPWQLRLNIRVVTVGSSGTVQCSGWTKVGSTLALMTEYALPATAVNPVTVNTTAASALTIGAQWGTNAAGDTITCQDCIIESF